MPEYQKLFPNPTDGEDVAMSKLEWLRDIVQVKYDQDMYTIFGGKDNYEYLMGKWNTTTPVNTNNTPPAPTYSANNYNNKNFTWYDPDKYKNMLDPDYN
jgi:hypothetical protein